jgi:glyoxylase-like metal-dependent hydrolase (beta-lactamase superfamily II)
MIPPFAGRRWPLLLGIVAAVLSLALTDDPVAPHIRVETLAPGVVAFVRTEPPGLGFDSNSVAIVNDDDVVVVDAQSSPESTREVLTAIRAVTSKPVSYVINTHAHFDHTIGNRVYKEAYPHVEFVAHERTRDDMLHAGRERLQQMLAHLPEMKTFFTGLLQKGEWVDGSPLNEEERASLTSDRMMAERYESIPAGFVPVLPSITLEQRLVLRRGTRTIDVRFLGRGHTDGDLVVYLPEVGVLMTGDLVVWPVPLVGSTSFPLDYATTLEALAGIRAGLIVPGHGPVFRDGAYVKQVSELLTAIATGTRAAAARGESLDEVRKSVNLDAFRDRFAGASLVRRTLFSTYVSGPGIQRAYEQAVAAH